MEYILMIVVMFLLFGAFFIISDSTLYLSKSEDVNTFFVSYGVWLGNLFSNSQTIVGYVTKAEWMPSSNE